MKILHLIHSTRTGGGAQAMLANLINHSGSSFKHHTVTLFSESDSPSVFEANHCLGLRSPRYLPSATLRLRRIIHDEKPDVVMSWMYNSCFLAALALPRKQKLIWSIHHSLLSLAEEKTTTRTMIRLCARASGRPDVIAYCADSIMPQHEAVGFSRKNAVAIPNGFDTTKFTPLDDSRRIEKRSALNLPDKAFLIGHAGRFHPMKNHASLIAAFALIAVHKPDLHLVLAGRGIDESNVVLLNEIARHDIRDRVSLIGVQQDMHGFLGSLNLYISASSFGEAFPMVIGEAMSCGTPVLTTDVGDSARIVGPHGFVALSPSPGDIASKLQEAVAIESAQWEKIRQAARRRICDEFSASIIARHYDDLFMRLRGQ